MSSIRLKNKKDIKDFFKILAEESVKDAKSKILDVGSKGLRAQEVLDNKAFGKIREEEEEEIPDDLDVSGFGALSSPESDDSGTADASVENVTDDSQLDSDIEDVSLDSIAKKIDLMRSGRSIKDSATEERMRTYFDKITEPERKALYGFLTAVASMMTGEASGEEAVDPSEPPYNVTMSSGEETAEVNIEDEVAVDDDVRVDVEDIEVEEEVEEEESETPIAVGSVQSKESISEIRKKVLSLLKRS